MANPILDSIYIFPVKGFPGIRLEKSVLIKGEGLPNDRRYAVTRGVEATGNWMPARSYYINAWVDGMLKFSVAGSPAGEVRLSNPSGQSLKLDFDDPDSISRANSEIMDFMQHVSTADEETVPQIVERDDKRGNWDYPDTAISIINAESLKEISRAFGKELDPVRFRGNLILSGMPAWEEFELKGKRIRLGEAELEVMRPIVRCPTPGVDPDTGERDLDFASLLPEHFGHAYCGMYATVVKSGKIAATDTLEFVGDAEMPLTTAAAEAEDYRIWPRMVEISFYETGKDVTRISLKNTGQWPLPQATPGQRLRFHLGPGNWTVEHIAAVSPGHYHLEVEKSVTGDPITEKLRTSYSISDKLVISGPFGKA